MDKELRPLLIYIYTQLNECVCVCVCLRVWLHSGNRWPVRDTRHCALKSSSPSANHTSALHSPQHKPICHHGNDYSCLTSDFSTTLSAMGQNTVKLHAVLIRHNISHPSVGSFIMDISTYFSFVCRHHWGAAGCSW